MLVFDPDKFAVGGRPGTVHVIPDRPLSEFGTIRLLTLDPREDPYPCLTLSIREVADAVDALIGEESSYFGIRQKIVRRELPHPVHEAEADSKRMPMRVFTLPEAEALFTFLQASYAKGVVGSAGLESAWRSMLEQLTAARNELQEYVE